MINSVDDYEYVTFLDEIKVSGDIMPFRSEQDKTLRGEDIAFCIEGNEERKDFLSSDYSMRYIDRQIKSDRLVGIVEDYQKLINGNPRMVTNYLSIQTQYGELKDYLQHYTFIEDWDENDRDEIATFDIGITELCSSTSDYLSGGALIKQNIQNLFIDNHKMDSGYYLQNVPYYWNATSQTVISSYWGNKPTWSIQDQRLTDYNYNHQEYFKYMRTYQGYGSGGSGSNYYSNVAIAQTMVNGGEFKIKLPESLNIEKVDNAKIIFHLFYQIIRPYRTKAQFESGYPEQENKAATIRYVLEKPITDLNIQNGWILLDWNDDVKNSFEIAMNHYGDSFNSIVCNGQLIYFLSSLRLERIDVVYSLDDRTKFHL